MDLEEVSSYLWQQEESLTNEEFLAYLDSVKLTLDDLSEDILPLVIDDALAFAGKSPASVKTVKSKSGRRTSKQNLQVREEIAPITLSRQIVEDFVSTKEEIRKASVDKVLKEFESLPQDIANDILKAVESTKGNRKETVSTIKLLGGLYYQLLEDSDRTPSVIDCIERTAKGVKGFESDYSDELAQKLAGQREVSVPTGLIDVLTATQIIEVKYFQYWKHAVGQVQMYGLYYPLHEKRVHLYGNLEQSKLELICKWTKQLGVTTTWEP